MVFVRFAVKVLGFFHSIMGNCCPCCGDEGYNDIGQPDPEERRRQQAAAAESRQKDGDKRGMKTGSMSEARRKQERLEEAERQQVQTGQGEPLRWQVE